MDEHVIAQLADTEVLEVGDFANLEQDWHRLRLFLETLREFAVGVNLGVTERLQRTHAVFLPKRKWKIAGQAEGDSRQHQFPELTDEPNCNSSQEHVDALERVLEEDLVPSARCETARMFKLTERQAREQFGNEYQVAKLKALIEDVDPNGRVKVRVLHDGTNSLSVNSHTKVRDADCSPTHPTSRGCSV